MLMLGAPVMGMPKMLIGEMLGSFLHIGSAAGWVMHVLIGLVLALIYAGWFAARLPGGPALRGAIYGFGVAITTSSTAALVTDLARRERYGAAHGVFGTIMDTGHASGPIAAGLLAGGLGVAPALAIIAALLGASAVVFAVLPRFETGAR